MKTFLTQVLQENQASPSAVTLADKGGSPQVKSTGSPRKPLTPIQTKLETKVGNGKEGKSPSRAKKSLDFTGFHMGKPSTSDPQTSSYLKRVQTGFVSKKKQQEKTEVGIQTESMDVCLVTSEVAPPEYWKQLAEQRRVALEETLKENKRLADKVETLEADNRNLEEMLEDAKTLAEMVNALSGDADDSGIVKDASFSNSI